MKTLEAIYTRRSVRKYKPGAVSRQHLEEIIKAGMYAPSARNKQPWHFVLVDQTARLEELSEAHPYGKMIADAGAAILVCGDTIIEETESFLIQGCSAATQNILLAAHDLGYGTVWLGMHPREERLAAIRKLFHIPDHIVAVSLIVVGLPDESKEMPDRFLKERIHFGGW